MLLYELYGKCVKKGDEHSTRCYMSSMDNVWREVVSTMSSMIMCGGGNEHSTCCSKSSMDNVWREVISTARAAI